MDSGALQNALEVKKHGQVWGEGRTLSGLCLEHRPLLRRDLCSRARVPDSHWTCQSDEFSDNGLVISQAVQDTSSPGDAAMFTASTKMGHCFVRFNLSLTVSQKFMLGSVLSAHGEGGKRRAALWPHLGENVEWEVLLSC